MNDVGNIQWFPGHMAKTRRIMASNLKLVDIVVELCDARIPQSSRNPEIDKIVGKKPRLMLLNKADCADAAATEQWLTYYRKKGIPAVACDCRSGRGVKNLLPAVREVLADKIAVWNEKGMVGRPIRMMIVGIPNVGKSSLINRILGEKRLIVSNIAGTTRDAVDTMFENEQGRYMFIDTAGIRRKSKVDEKIEKFSVMRSQLAVERADVCIIMIDARDGVTEQDTKVAGLAHEAGKACIIVVNKWDLVEKDGKTMDRMREDIRRDLSYMPYDPILFISALTGQRVNRLFELINYVNDQAAVRITTGMLNSVLADAQTRVQPPTDKGRRLKIYYMTQVGVKPPHFVIFCNDKKLFHFSYQRYLENQIRSVFGLEGTPIIMTVRQKVEEDS